MANSDDLMEKVILVDESDQQTGIAAKIAAHKDGDLHRAFSIFLFSPNGKTLVQRRALTKYHSGGLWANTACGHPRPGEPIAAAANRRLGEELGMEADLIKGFELRYKAAVGGEMIENEYVHVFVGLTAQTPRLNPQEVCDYSYHEIEALRSGCAVNTGDQAAWLRYYLAHHCSKLIEAREVVLRSSL